MDDDLRVSKNWQATPQGNGTTAVKWNLRDPNESQMLSHYQRHHPLHNVHISPLSNNINMTTKMFSVSLSPSQAHGKGIGMLNNILFKNLEFNFLFFFIAPKFQRQCQALICGWWRWWSSVDDLQQAPSTNWELRSVVSGAPKLLW